MMLTLICTPHSMHTFEQVRNKRALLSGKLILHLFFLEGFWYSNTVCSNTSDSQKPFTKIQGKVINGNRHPACSSKDLGNRTGRSSYSWGKNGYLSVIKINLNKLAKLNSEVY